MQMIKGTDGHLYHHNHVLYVYKVRSKWELIILYSAVVQG